MVITTLPAGAGERISVKVSPAVAFAPANLVVRAMIEADQDNRAVEIVAESADFYRSSQTELEGDKAPRTSTFEFRSLPPGTYEVRAMLLGAGGAQRAFARQTINVIASDIPADCQGVNGVAHHRAAPIAVVVATPPTNPSQVLFGLTCGAILCRPRVFPQTYCNTSLI